MNCQLASLSALSFRVILFVVMLCCLLSIHPHQTSQAQTPALGAWTNYGNINTGRYNHSATLLPNGKILIVGGYIAIPPNSNTTPTTTNSAEIYNPATKQSNPTGSLNLARADHNATLLLNGKVLVVSGNSAELYDPATGGWVLTTNSVFLHNTSYTFTSRFTSTLLPDGKVLVIGGNCNNCPTTSAELYDPVSQNWKATGRMILSSRINHSATLLSNGKVLVAGGSNSLSNAEIYDPATDTWTATSNLNNGRSNPGATLLLNGKVLVFGGNAFPSTSSEIYDPVTSAWSSTGNINKSGTTFSLTNDGKVLISGGRGNIASSVSELYDPSTGAWFFTADLNRPRLSHAVVTLSDGRVLAIGGRSDSSALKSVEVFTPNQVSPTGFWTLGLGGSSRYAHTATLLPNGNVMLAGGTGTAGRLNNAYTLILNNSFQYWEPSTFTISRQNHTATLLPNGKVLLTGGEANLSTSLASCELYSPGWTSIFPMLTPRRLHTATLLNNGKVLVAGGANEDVDVSSAEIYDYNSGLWSGGGLMSVGRRQHTATLLTNGKVMVVGGSRNGVPLAGVEIYDPVSGNWSTATSLKFARYGHIAALLNNGKVLIVGGTGNNLIAECEIYDPATGQWSDAGQISQPRRNHAAAMLNDGRVIVTGGSDNEGTLSSVELFDPMANGGAGGWNRVASLKTARELHSVLLMPNGRIFVFCGRNANGEVSDSIEIFDPTGGSVVPFSPSNITPVSASTFRGGNFAPESIVAIFGERLASKIESSPSFGGTRVDVRDSLGQTRPAALFFVSPTQINCQTPQNTAAGTAVITLTASSGASVSASINVSAVAPGIFSADASGTGLAAATVLRVKANGEQVYEPAVRYDTALNRFVAVPIDLSDSREQVFLILNGTGWRFRSRLSAVIAMVGGTETEVIYAGQQGSFIGLDQANLRLPMSLAGRGTVEVKMTVDGVATNVVTVAIK